MSAAGSGLIYISVPVAFIIEHHARLRNLLTGDLTKMGERI